MADKISKERRSWNMARIRSKDTSPEKRVRSLLHKHGYRFRLHDKSLPGSPDVVLKKHRTAIFVHGCYWHRHPGCKYAYTPRSRVEFWEEKFRSNVMRDKKYEKMLIDAGWDVLTIWECEAKSPEQIKRVLRKLFIE